MKYMERKRLALIEHRLDVAEARLQKRDDADNCAKGKHVWGVHNSITEGNPPYIICKHCGKGPEKK